jgi:hypothetical protein
MDGVIMSLAIFAELVQGYYHLDILSAADIAEIKTKKRADA